MVVGGGNIIFQCSVFSAFSPIGVCSADILFVVSCFFNYSVVLSDSERVSSGLAMVICCPGVITCVSVAHVCACV